MKLNTQAYDYINRNSFLMSYKCKSLTVETTDFLSSITQQVKFYDDVVKITFCLIIKNNNASPLDIINSIDNDLISFDCNLKSKNGEIVHTLIFDKHYVAIKHIHDCFDIESNEPLKLTVEFRKASFLQKLISRFKHVYYSSYL